MYNNNTLIIQYTNDAAIVKQWITEENMPLTNNIHTTIILYYILYILIFL